MLTLTRFSWGKKIIALTFLVILLVFTIASVGTVKEEVSPLEGFVRDHFAPLYYVLNAAGQKLSQWASYPVLLVKAAKENEQLKQTIERLEVELREAEELKQENERLKVLLNWKEKNGGRRPYMAASVVARNPDNWFGTVIINRGREDGLKTNMTVVVPAGLVGRVANVSSSTAEVLLITDPRSGVGALVQKTRVPGIVEGIASSTLLKMNHIPGNLKVTKGDTVVTSGQGSIYPKGIAIGKIIDVQEEASGLFQVATVKPFVDFNRLEEVLIIK